MEITDNHRMLSQGYEILDGFKSIQRWKVIFEHPSGCGYKLGVYFPEFADKASIDSLEKHSGPELFLLINGTVKILVRDYLGTLASEKELWLQPGQAVLVWGYHNAYSPDRGSLWVLEECAMKTETMAIHRF